MTATAAHAGVKEDINLSCRLGATFLAGWALVGGAHAQDDWSATSDSFICRSSSEVREVKTYVSRASAGSVADHPGCRVDYIKDGKTRMLWSSTTNRSYCHGKALSLAAKLTATNFTCERLHLERP
jgi:hypothetical protein